jgi:hypothetical protein
VTGPLTADESDRLSNSCETTTERLVVWNPGYPGSIAPNNGGTVSATSNRPSKLSRRPRRLLGSMGGSFVEPRAVFSVAFRLPCTAVRGMKSTRIPRGPERHSCRGVDPSPTVPPDSSDVDHARLSLSHRASNTLGPNEQLRWDTRWEDSPDRSVPPRALGNGPVDKPVPHVLCPPRG